MNASINYVYENGRWMRETVERLTPHDVVKNVLGVLFLVACVVLGVMAHMCGR